MWIHDLQLHHPNLFQQYMIEFHCQMVLNIIKDTVDDIPLRKLAIKRVDIQHAGIKCLFDIVDDVVQMVCHYYEPLNNDCIAVARWYIIDDQQLTLNNMMF